MKIPRWVAFLVIVLALFFAGSFLWKKYRQVAEDGTCESVETNVGKSLSYKTEQQWVTWQVTNFLAGFADVAEGKIAPVKITFGNSSEKVSVSAVRSGKSAEWSLECVWEPSNYEKWGSSSFCVGKRALVQGEKPRGNER